VGRLQLASDRPGDRSPQFLHFQYQLVAPAVLPPVSSARFAVATLWDTLLLGGAGFSLPVIGQEAGPRSFYIFNTNW
jgi:hypothetical protein